MMSKEYALIVAGGSGSRMKSDVPKQFMKIGKMPVLMHTISSFFRFSAKINIILVLPQNQIDFWKELCNQYKFLIPHIVIEGGKRRQDSVKNGLDAITDEEGLVAIHDGVRPFITEELLKEVFDVANTKGNAITSVALKDSIRYVTAENSKAVNRTHYRLVQTPQVFIVSQIKKAYEICKGDFTDDASVAEFAGYKIHLVEGSYDNIKITTSEDLDYAEAIIKRSDI